MKYGDLPKPEEPARVEVVRDPIREILAAWHTFNALTDESTLPPRDPFNNAFYARDPAEQLYNAAAPLFHADAKPDGKAVLEALQPYWDWRMGVFCTAMLNSTALESLVVPWSRDSNHWGYKLAEGKTLVLPAWKHLPKEHMNIGKHAAGNIISWADVFYFADMARGGVQANFGFASHIAEGALGGVQMNYEWSKFLSFDARGGVQLNFGKTEAMGCKAKAGVQANLGYVDAVLGTEGSASIHAGTANHSYDVPINLQCQTWLSRLYDLLGGRKKYGAKTAALRDAREAVKQVEWLKQYKNLQPDRAFEFLSTVQRFNWQGWSAKVQDVYQRAAKVWK